MSWLAYLMPIGMIFLLIVLPIVSVLHNKNKPSKVRRWFRAMFSTDTPKGRW